jgi:hypothetical protein
MGSTDVAQQRSAWANRVATYPALWGCCPLDGSGFDRAKVNYRALAGLGAFSPTWLHARAAELLPGQPSAGLGQALLQGSTDQWNKRLRCK